MCETTVNHSVGIYGSFSIESHFVVIVFPWFQRNFNDFVREVGYCVAVFRALHALWFDLANYSAHPAVNSLLSMASSWEIARMPCQSFSIMRVKAKGEASAVPEVKTNRALSFMIYLGKVQLKFVLNFFIKKSCRLAISEGFCCPYRT